MDSPKPVSLVTFLSGDKKVTPGGRSKVSGGSKYDSLFLQEKPFLLILYIKSRLFYLLKLRTLEYRHIFNSQQADFSKGSG